MPKSTVEQIRQRFDNDVERFSSLETGQSACDGYTVYFSAHNMPTSPPTVPRI